MRKHIFDPVEKKKLNDTTWTVYECRYCGKRSELDAWQIAALSRDAALCEKSPIGTTIIEWTRSYYDCNCDTYKVEARLEKELILLGALILLIIFICVYFRN